MQEYKPEMILKTEILKDENEDSLRDEVNEFIKNKKGVKLTWQAIKNGSSLNCLTFICFIEYVHYIYKE